MLQVLEAEEEISAAQSHLEDTIQKCFSQRRTKNIGFPGGTEVDALVFTDGSYWFRSADHRYDTHRKLNWFGEYNETSPSLNITVEVNTPYKGINSAVAGFFVRDTDTGNIYLFHSGRIGGGKSGVGKKAFFLWSDLKSQECTHSKNKSQYGTLVMPIDGTTAPRAAIRFIRKVADFKRAVRSGETASEWFQQKLEKYGSYYSEATGHRTGKRSETIDYFSRHGDVVEALKCWREANLGKAQKIVKNNFIDLGVTSKGSLVELYEVKTSTDRNNIYSAVGQLLIHSPDLNCKKTIVIPAQGHVEDDILRAFARIGVDVVRFTFDETWEVTILPQS